MTGVRPDAQLHSYDTDWLGQKPWCVHAQRVGVSPQLADFPRASAASNKDGSEIRYQADLSNSPVTSAPLAPCRLRQETVEGLPDGSKVMGYTDATRQEHTSIRELNGQIAQQDTLRRPDRALHSFPDISGAESPIGLAGVVSYPSAATQQGHRDRNPAGTAAGAAEPARGKENMPARHCSALHTNELPASGGPASATAGIAAAPRGVGARLFMGAVLAAPRPDGHGCGEAVTAHATLTPLALRSRRSMSMHAPALPAAPSPQLQALVARLRLLRAPDAATVHPAPLPQPATPAHRNSSTSVGSRGSSRSDGACAGAAVPAASACKQERTPVGTHERPASPSCADRNPAEVAATSTASTRAPRRDEEHSGAATSTAHRAMRLSDSDEHGASSGHSQPTVVLRAADGSRDGIEPPSPCVALRWRPSGEHADEQPLPAAALCRAQHAQRGVGHGAADSPCAVTGSMEGSAQTHAAYCADSAAARPPADGAARAVEEMQSRAVCSPVSCWTAEAGFVGLAHGAIARHPAAAQARPSCHRGSAAPLLRGARPARSGAAHPHNSSSSDAEDESGGVHQGLHTVSPALAWGGNAVAPETERSCSTLCSTPPASKAHRQHACCHTPCGAGRCSTPSLGCWPQQTQLQEAEGTPPLTPLYATQLQPTSERSACASQLLEVPSSYPGTGAPLQPTQLQYEAATPLYATQLQEDTAACMLTPPHPTQSTPQHDPSVPSTQEPPGSAHGGTPPQQHQLQADEATPAPTPLCPTQPQSTPEHGPSLQEPPGSADQTPLHAGRHACKPAHAAQPHSTPSIPGGHSPPELSQHASTARMSRAATTDTCGRSSVARSELSLGPWGSQGHGTQHAAEHGQQSRTPAASQHGEHGSGPAACMSGAQLPSPSVTWCEFSAAVERCSIAGSVVVPRSPGLTQELVRHAGSETCCTVADKESRGARLRGHGAVVAPPLLLQGVLWTVGDLEAMLAAPEEASLEEVLLRCATVRLQCCAEPDAACAGDSQSSMGAPTAEAEASVAITSANGAVKGKHVAAAILELVRGVPGSEQWVFDGMAKCSAAGRVPVVYELSFIR
eukprot:jgi/Ulvmu1/10268/UM060_0070.1